MNSSKQFLTALALVLACLIGVMPLAAQDAAAASESEDDKVLYALGMAMAQRLVQLELSADELAQIQAGLADAVLGRDPKVDLQTYGPKIQGFAEQRMARQAAVEKAASQSFLDEQASAAGAERTDSGLIITELTAGDGASPSATDRVTVHYHGTLRDGTVFDSSVDRGQPATFGLNQVISCWTEALQRMKVGGKSRLVCPSDIAYGDQGRPGIPGGAPLVFEVELLGIEAPPEGP